MNRLNNSDDPKDPILNEAENNDINDSSNEDMDLEIEGEDGMMNDIVIEIDDEDIDILNLSEDIGIVEDDIKLEEADISDLVEDDEDPILSKHKIQGKHSLKYDSIFKGKKEDPLVTAKRAALLVGRKMSVESSRKKSEKMKLK